MNKILYHLPGAFQHFEVYKYFLPLFRKNRNKFYDSAEIYCIYGAPAFFTWTGGRTRSSYKHFPPYDEVKNFYKYYDVNVSLVASNLLLTECDLYDKYCNAVLEYYNDKGNSIIISNELLHKYVNENFKNYTLISSTTKCLSAEETIKEYDRYDIVVLDYNLNNNWNFLNSLNDSQKSKTEFLMNHVCGINCKRRKQHYEFISNEALYRNTYPFHYCEWEHIDYYTSMTRPYILTVNRVMNEYFPKGFSHFKIEGRNQSLFFLIKSLVHYLVKPEYKEEILCLLMNRLNYK